MQPKTNPSTSMLVLATVPLILAMVFCVAYQPVFKTRMEDRMMTTTVKDRHGNIQQSSRGKVTLSVLDAHVMFLSHVVHTESTIGTRQMFNAVVLRISEATSRTHCLVAFGALLVFGVVAYKYGWDSMLYEGPPRLGPSRVFVITTCVIGVLAGCCYFAKVLVENSTNELSGAFQHVKLVSWAMLYLVLFVPLVEELLFRATLQRLLSRSLPLWGAIVIQAVVFAGLHLVNPLHMLVGLFGGLAFGILYVVTNRIWIPIASHSIANAVFILAVL